MSEELEIVIDASGRMQVTVTGRPGKACLDYVDLFRDLMGPVVEQTPTAEMYVAEGAGVSVGQRVSRD